MAADASNRTLVLSVVAVDLVAYSQKSVAEQMSLKDHFNQVLLQAIRDISIADRIILDTGDGVAMGFLGDPEDALYVAMFMHDAINRDGANGGVIRIGINLGPVKLATGVGGHPNIIGDGINVAERIMGFAEPGQFTASRPVFEIMSRMSDHYANLFRYAGVHTDKQVRSHDVYLVGKSADAFHHAQRGVTERAAARAGQPVIPPVIAKVLAQVPAAPPIKPASPAPAVAAKRDPEPAAAAGKLQEPARTATRPVVSLPPQEVESGERGHLLIDFLDDRNKVAITATLLAIVAVILAALLAYRKMLVLQPDTHAPAIAALSPSPTTKETGPVEFPPPAKPAPATASPAAVVPPPATGSTAAPKAEPKLEPKAAAPLATGAPSGAPVPAAPVNKPPAPAAAPAKTVEPPPSSARSGTTPPGVVRDTAKAAKDVKPEKPERVDQSPPAARSGTTAPGAVRDTVKAAKEVKPDKPAPRDEVRPDARKPAPARTSDREKPPTGTAAPIMPTYQSPAATPRPEVVTPTQALPAPPPPAAVADPTIVIISRIEPAYPIEAVRQSISSGSAKARITIDAKGSVSDVVILESRPISAFGRETSRAVRQWKFNPGAAGRVLVFETSFKP